MRQTQMPTDDTVSNKSRTEKKVNLQRIGGSILSIVERLGDGGGRGQILVVVATAVGGGVSFFLLLLTGYLSFLSLLQVAFEVLLHNKLSYACTTRSPDQFRRQSFIHLNSFHYRQKSLSRHQFLHRLNKVKDAGSACKTSCSSQEALGW